MHEVGIAFSILDAVEKELNRHPDMRAAKIGLKIGEFAGVDSDSLRFCFEAITKAADMAPIVLDIELCEASKGHRGDELDIAYVELEEITQSVEVGA